MNDNLSDELEESSKEEIKENASNNDVLEDILDSESKKVDESSKEEIKANTSTINVSEKKIHSESKEVAIKETDKEESSDNKNEAKNAQRDIISSTPKDESATNNETSINLQENKDENVESTTKKENADEENKSTDETITETKINSVSVEDEVKSTSSNVADSDVDYAKHVTYNEDGSAIYTDPKTKYKYKWCSVTDKWKPCETEDLYENEHYKWCQKTLKWIPKQTQVTETEHYKWDADKKEWIPKVQKEVTDGQAKEITYDIDEDGNRTYTDKDGTVFFWDDEKSAWFPKIDEDFMAQYQMNYGFIDNTSESDKQKEINALQEVKRKEEELKKLTQEAITNDEASKAPTATGAKRKAQQEPPQWFEMDPSRNTKVYVSNLPLDITLEEFAELMGKCGMIMRDPTNQKFKLKLYAEADGQIKGDGLCDYIKVESVDLALKILDDYNLRGNKIRVQRAQFQMRGEYNPALKPKRKKKDKEKLAKIKEKLFDWRPEKMRGERSKNERTVIIKNLFHPELFEKEVQLILDYQNDLREECSKCGTVKKVIIYDRHSEGVAQVNMTTPEEADMVIQMMQGRFFGKRQLTAEHWDGKTKYKVEETEEEIQKRLSTWDKYLETTEVGDNTKTPITNEDHQ